MTTYIPLGLTDYPPAVDYWLEQGADWSETLTLTGVDLTGATAVLTCRAYPGQPVPVFDISSAGTTPLITLNPSADTVSWTIPGAQTAAFLPALNTPVGFCRTPTDAFLGYYDLVITSSTGAIVNEQHGQLAMVLGISGIARAPGGIITPPTV